MSLLFKNQGDSWVINSKCDHMITICSTCRKSKSSHRRCSVKKMFLGISQNSQENTCARVSILIKLQACNFILKYRLWHRCFPVNFVKFLRTPFLQNTSGRLLLKISQTVIRTWVLLCIPKKLKVNINSNDYRL